MRNFVFLKLLLPAMGLVFASGCIRTSSDDVVVYAALDEEFSRPILDDFESHTSFHVRPLFDTEATKTVGLATRLLKERKRPQCDVFWNNEVLHTIRLARAGLLQPFAPSGTDDWPSSFRGKRDLWIGFAARARVLIVNTDKVPADERPSSIMDLTNEKWKGQAGIARPLFGTTATHAAVLYDAWGKDKTEQFFRDIKDNCVVLTGNKQVAEAVANGQLAFGITDTDDAIIELERQRPVTIVFPDQGAGELGTLFIPNTLSIIKNCPHPQAARELVDYLVKPDVEKMLARGASAQFPVNPQAREASRIAGVADVRWMDAEFDAAADWWDESSRFLDGLFGTGVPQ